MVAPIARNSPRANAGFKILAASIAPSPPPAPTRVWISSMNRTISPSAAVTSFTTDFNRSSNSPLYLAPAINAPISRENTILSFKLSGTSPSTIRCANPSAMAVFPTPGSPTSIGLFLVLRVRICNTLRISSSRPITGSSFPARANSLRFLAYLFKELYVSSADAEVTRSPFRNSSIAAFNPFPVTP